MPHEDPYIQGVDNARIIETAEYNLFAVLRPTIKPDGDQWCVLYGDNPQEGVAGFGKSPYQAVIDFNKAWHSLIETANNDVEAAPVPEGIVLSDVNPAFSEQRQAEGLHPAPEVVENPEHLTHLVGEDIDPEEQFDSTMVV